MGARQRIFALMVKEFLAILRDPRSRFVVIGPPVIQMIVFGYAATYDLSHVPYAVYDEDRGAAARQLLAGFEGSENFQQVAMLTHHDEIAPLIDRKHALMLIHLGPAFSRDLEMGRRAPVQIILDGRDSNTALIALGYVQQIVADFSDRWTRDHGGTGPPAAIVSRAWFNPSLQGNWFMIPGIVGLLTLVVTTVVTALSVAREREQGTFDQLLVTPLRPVEILIGKALPGFAIGIFETTLIVLVAVFWFRVPLLGNPATLYAGLLLFLLSTIGVGLMISSLAVTMQQGLLGAFLFLVPAIILSGFTTPIANMPPAVQYLTLLNPLRYFMVIIRGVFLEGAPLQQLINQLWPMALIGAVNMTLAAWLFRHRMY